MCAAKFRHVAGTCCAGVPDPLDETLSHLHPMDERFMISLASVWHGKLEMSDKKLVDFPGGFCEDSVKVYVICEHANTLLATSDCPARFPSLSPTA